jgi:endonuclease/exonuclease/phosphatase family metal-dependent hydrolase
MRRNLFVLFVASMILAFGAASHAAERPVKTMSRNLYLGANLTPAVTALILPALILANYAVWQAVQATDFPARAQELADEIVDKDPHLIGLQEVATWKVGAFGDPAPASTVVYDFLASLQAALAARGEPYDLVVIQREAEIEAPASDFSTFFADVRLEMNDAILVKQADLALGEIVLANPQSANFQNNLTLPTAAGPITVRRGWTAVDATVNRRSFRFVNTHLEAFSAGFRALQAGELLAGPLALPPTQAVVLVGDLNSDPDNDSSTPTDPTPNNLAYNLIVGVGGFADTEWEDSEGPTCCHADDLLNPSAEFTGRIDHVLHRGGVVTVRKDVFGDDPDEKTLSGLWASDHGGVIATLQP